MHRTHRAFAAPGFRRIAGMLVLALMLAGLMLTAAGAGRESANVEDLEVLPLTLPLLRPERQTAADRLYQALMRQANYLLTTVHPWAKDASMKLLTDSRSSEHWIRPNTGTLVGLAVLRRFGPYDARVVGVSRDALLRDTIVPMMRYLVATHRTGDRATGDGKPWGDAWQSAHWAYALGRAAWLVWDDLPPDVRAGVRRVIAHEAGRFVDATPPHGMKGDTKAEENAWNSRIFSAAVLLMPNDPRRDAWEKAFVRWAISSFMRPADADNPTVLDGRPVSEWFNGPCIFNDFTCENHGFVHPGYMGCIGIPLSCHLDFRLTGRAAPRAVAWNAAGVYENLKWMATPDGGYIYPSGQDWSLFRNPQKAHLHLLMAAFEGDPDGWSLAEQGWRAMTEMQARSDDGRVFLPSEYRFPSTQHDTIAMIGLQWMVLHVADLITDRPVPRIGTRHLEVGGIVLQRTPRAFVTLSYGAKVMAQVAAMRLDRIVSPAQRSLVGSVWVAGEKGPKPVKATGVDVDVQPDRFTARLSLAHGPAVRADLMFRTEPDGTLHVRETLTAVKDMTLTRVATGLIGVLNNPRWIYETGKRTITLGDKATVVPAHSGKVLTGTVKRVGIDDTVAITSPALLRVHYEAAKGPNRGRATDQLHLNWLDGERAFKAGDTITRYEATICVR